MSNETTARPLCSKCDQNEAGPGGILCPGCFEAISAQTLPEG